MTDAPAAALSRCGCQDARAAAPRIPSRSVLGRARCLTAELLLRLEGVSGL